MPSYDRNTYSDKHRSPLHFAFFATTLMLLTGCTTTVAPHQSIHLFDGETLEGWDKNDTWFHVEEKAIVAGSMEKNIPRHEYLCTLNDYDDFELNFKAKLIGKSESPNGGVMIRSQRMPDGDVVGYQVDLRDHYWGSLYDSGRRLKVLAQAPEAEVDKILNPTGWNDYRVRCQGKRIEVWINGYQTVDYTEPNDLIPQTGVIGVQIHKGTAVEAWYKDITLQPLQ
ncbi:DUF1080 domain-containing protein [Pontiellaceae bacterium B1224]|nr:DUF1080 domain-containing protein [Pontiellaceae bacterium B1224]